jgi:hypothetical protein
MTDLDKELKAIAKRLLRRPVHRRGPFILTDKALGKPEPQASLDSCKALLELDAAGALTPHGLGGHGRTCLGWAIAEIKRLRKIEAAAKMWRQSLREDDWETDAIENGLCRPGLNELMRLIPDADETR